MTMVRFGQILSFISGSIIGIYQWVLVIEWLDTIFPKFVAFWISTMSMPSIILFPFIHKWIEGVWPPKNYLLLFAVMYGGVFLTIMANRLTDEIRDDY